MTSYEELRNHSPTTSAVTNDCEESGSISLHSNPRVHDNESLLQKQYSLIHKSYSDQMVKKRKVVCCGNEKTRPWFLRSAFLVVIALGLVISYFEVRFSIYSSKTVTINSGDQLLLPLSTYLNKEVKFHINNYDDYDNLKMYILKKMPEVSSNVVSYNAGIKFQIASWTYQYWGFYLLNGSSIRISLCTDLQVQFYIIKGQKKLQKWTQEILYDGYHYHANIFPKASCDKKSDFKSHLLKVYSSDVYYILFSSSAGWRFLTDISILLQFNRTYYDMKDLKYSCILSNKSCTSKLDYASTDISVVESVLPIKSKDPFHRIKLTYIPVCRHTFYFKLFVGIYLTICAISMVYIIWRICVNSSRTDIRKGLILSNQILRDYSTINENPWVVVSTINRISSREVLCQVEERETRSMLGDNHENMEQSLVDSLNSRDFMRHQNESANYMFTNEYNTEQQLLDSCLTAAGASAV